MPNTPQVKFNFQNNNVLATTPMLGVSHVVARTMKGPFNDPSTLLSTFAQFQSLYGAEIVPDGSVSNIQKAFELGSKLRVSRVSGYQDPEYGHAVPIDSDSDVDPSIVCLKLIDPDDDNNYMKVNLQVKTTEAGAPVIDSTGYNLNRDFYLVFSVSTAAKNNWYLYQYKNSDLANENLLASNLFLAGSKSGASSSFVEKSALRTFLDTAPNVTFEFKSASASSEELGEVLSRIKNMDGVVSWLGTYDQWRAEVYVDDTLISAGESVELKINEGKDGGDSTADTWYKAYEATMDYQDGYQLICSHIHQHNIVDADGNTDPSGWLNALSQVADSVKKHFEIMLYVEIPKFQADGITPQTVDTIVSQAAEIQGAVGYHKSIAYFCGGLQYYDDDAVLQDCDVLGSVVGLGDTAATQVGPYYSFSGMNRGVLAEAVGPVIDNLGSPSRVDDLQTLAEWYLNVMCIKDTPTQGKQTMLWHGFTSNPKDDSEKFISTVRLNLFLKKNLRPLLESYIEEPNTFDTWDTIYRKAKKDILDPLLGIAMSEYTWMGDQDASSYAECSVNTEEEVRQGKYHVILKYKDIVPLQEVTIDIVIDAASQSVDITSNE